MDTSIPSYGTNGGVQEQSQDNIFDLFHTFLGHFWHSDRTGGIGSIDQAFGGQDIQGIFSHLFQGNS